MKRGTLDPTPSPGAREHELVERLAEGRGVRIERIVSRGHASPEGSWYDQDEDEFVLLVRGRGVLELEDGTRVEMRPGDWTELAAHERHRVAFTDPDEDTVWLCVFY